MAGRLITGQPQGREETQMNTMSIGEMVIWTLIAGFIVLCFADYALGVTIPAALDWLSEVREQ